MLGAQIYNLRKKKGVTQKELAQALSVVPQAVSRWERQDVDPNLELLPQIADYFEVSLDELFGRGTYATAEEHQEKIREIVRQELKNLLNTASASIQD